MSSIPNDFAAEYPAPGIWLAGERTEHAAGNGIESARVWRRRYQRRLAVTDTATTAATITFATAAAVALDPTTSAHELPPWGIGVVLLAAWLICLAAFRTRDPHETGAGNLEYRRLASASVVTAGVLALFFLLSDIEPSRRFVLIAIPLGLIALLTERWLWRRWLVRRRAHGAYLDRAIVVGRRSDLEYVVGRVDGRLGGSYAVIGVATDDGTAPVGGAPVIGGLLDAAAHAGRLNADAVIVAGQPSESRSFIRELGWQLEGTSAELVLSSGLADIAGPRIHFRPVEGLPLIHVEIPSYEGGKHVLKRAVDLVLSALALLALWPLFAAIAIAIKLDDGGPVLFRQERTGRNGSTFRMIKFRSMVTTAERDLAALRELNEGSGLLFKIRNDPRVTRVGRVIRKYSLDELPQIWNILIGDMSIVGPRPPLVSEADAYEGAVRRRLYIKPGLTGMWQVNGRSDLSWEDSVRLDLYYVENWSLVGDLVIMWRTVSVLLKPTGAY